MVHVSNYCLTTTVKASLPMETIQKERVEKDRFKQAVGIKMEWKEEWEGYTGRTEDNSYAV